VIGNHNDMGRLSTMPALSQDGWSGGGSSQGAGLGKGTERLA